MYVCGGERERERERERVKLTKNVVTVVSPFPGSRNNSYTNMQFPIVRHSVIKIINIFCSLSFKRFVTGYGILQFKGSLSIYPLLHIVSVRLTSFGLKDRFCDKICGSSFKVVRLGDKKHY